MCEKVIVNKDGIYNLVKFFKRIFKFGKFEVFLLITKSKKEEKITIPSLQVEDVGGRPCDRGC